MADNLSGYALISAQRLRELAGGISRATLFRWRQTMPDFPTPVRISGRTYYRENEVTAWLERQREVA